MPEHAENPTQDSLTLYYKRMFFERMLSFFGWEKMFTKASCISLLKVSRKNMVVLFYKMFLEII